MIGAASFALLLLLPLAAAGAHRFRALVGQNEALLSTATCNMTALSTRLNELAAKHRKTAAQIVLRWHLDSGFVVIPKSVTPERIESNFDVFDFQLDHEDMAVIAKLEQNYRIGPNPDTFD